MFEKKKLMINCEICDARKIAEEDYAKFESIVLNTEILFVNDRARGILARLPVTMNAAETIELPEGKEIDMRVYSGSSQLGPDDSVSENTMIIANGSLQLLPGAQETVARCYKIIVNGSLRCPQSMAGCLGRISCNGKTDVYPDDAVVLDKKYVMDRFFPLRARQDAKYYAEKQILIGDGALDAAKLAAKNVSFITKKLVVPEALVEPLAPLFDVNTEFEVVPEGYAIVPDSADLDEALLQKYGRSLYVCGDLDIGIEAKELIAGLERLIVTGCVSMPKSCKAAFDALHAQCGSIELVKGKVVGN
ncbi:MAG: hypothetical protein Q4A66_11900, partial [Eubacteriales bacterium]|nr:hypothetical protein [Eubacteriales bacterium]